MSTDKLTWYVARSGGIVAWCLLALALVWGLLLSSRVLGRRTGPAWLLAVHRHVGGLSVAFTAVHVGAVMLDDFVDFGFVEVLVPMASEWRPGPVAWGIVGMYLLVAIEVTSLAMRWLPKRLWRGVHWSSAALFVVATVHGWQAGTDAGRAFIVVIVASIGVLAALTTVRIVRSRRAVPDPSRAEMLARLRAGDDAAPVETAQPVAVAGPPARAQRSEWATPTPVRARSSLLLDQLVVTTSVEDLPPWPVEAGDLSFERPDIGAFDEARETGPVAGVWKRRQTV